MSGERFSDLIFDRPLVRVAVNDTGKIEVASWSISDDDSMEVVFGFCTLDPEQIPALVKMLRKACAEAKRGV